LWVWALLIVVFFSVSITKLITYIFPALPALALLLGDALSEYQLPAKAWKFAMRANIALMALLGIILIALPHLKFAEKIADVAVFQSWFTISGIVLFAGALAMLIRGRFPRAQILTQGLVALLFVFIFPFCVGAVAPYEDISHVVQRLSPLLSPNTKLVQFDTFQPTLIYYTHRPVTVIHQENTSGYNAREYQQSSLFLEKYSDIDTVLNTPNPVVVLVRWKMANIVALRSLHYWGGNNDFALLSNRPAPNGWPLEYIAPGKRDKANFPHANAK
jgi:4-amino-4-deoxy-L-arabinose transferase-like glycosyltransferase